MESHFSLLATQRLPAFPSGSSINFWNGQLYIIGDDATCMLVLSTAYSIIDSVRLFEYPDKRIPKTDKTDFEGSTIFTKDGFDYLLLVGSAATNNRQKVCVIPLLNSKPELAIQKQSFYETHAFIRRMQAAGIPEVNLEGVCTLGSDLLLGNRGNQTHSTNHILVTSQDFWKHPEDAGLLLLSLVVPGNDRLGLSELCYIAGHDLLLITLTSEDTDNAYDDGAIGDSYLGWIENVSKKLMDTHLRLDAIVNLSDIDLAFKNNKIEGICVESIASSHAVLHLIADNDTGESQLFTMQWTF